MNISRRYAQRIISRNGSGGSEPKRASAESLRIDLAERSLKSVLDADIHLDNKAGRILGAIAFLTAAAGSVFAKVYSDSLPTDQIQTKIARVLSGHVAQKTIDMATAQIALEVHKKYVTIFGVDWPVFAFAVYLLCVLCGTLLYLAAMGPALHIPDWFGAKSKVDDHANGEPTSRLFFKNISEFDRKKWEDYWRTDQEALEKCIAEDYVREAHLIAQKTLAKYNYMRKGSQFFRVAVSFLSILAASLFNMNLTWFWRFAFIGTIAMSLLSMADVWQRPDHKTRLSEKVFTIVTIIVFTVLLTCNRFHLI